MINAKSISTKRDANVNKKKTERFHESTLVYTSPHPREYFMCSCLWQVSWLGINMHLLLPILYETKQWITYMHSSTQWRDRVGFTPNFPIKLLNLRAPSSN